MIGSDRRATIIVANTPRGKDQTVPSGTDSRWNGFQAINCLATIIQSLQDLSLQDNKSYNGPRFRLHITGVVAVRGRGRGGFNEALYFR
jgi:hypothetical protein